MIKWNWGTGIAVFLGLFITAIGTLLYFSLQQRTDLVTSDYYAKELVYQEMINRQVRARELGGRARLEIVDQELWLRFPQVLQGQVASAQIEMYCQNDQRLDFKLSYSDWAVSDLRLPGEKLARGKWIAKLWVDLAEDSLYYAPEIILP